MNWTFPLALTFLTIFPWPRLPLAGPQDLARSMFWFPWVGALLGLLYWGAWSLLRSSFPALAAATVLIILTVLATRGLHLDGLADTADGLGGGASPKERLRIMKDSRLGAFGAIALMLVLMGKLAFLTGVVEKEANQAVLLFPVISRWGMVLLAYLCPYARIEGGLGQAMAAGVQGGTLLGATGSALLLVLVVSGFRGAVLLAGAGLFVWLLSRYTLKKLGGVTGDVFGAANEILETLVLGGAVWLWG